MKHINVLKKVVLKDRTLNALKEKAEKIIKLEIIQAISAKHKPNEYKYDFKKRNSRGKQFLSTGTVFANRFAAQKKEDREKIYAELTNKQFAETDLKNESLSMKADLKSQKSVLEQIDLTKEFSFMFQNPITKGTMDDLLGTETSSSVTATSGGVTATEAKDINKLEFNLNEVKCIDATDPEKTLWVTNYDEISMGGVTISDKGEEKKISEFSVSEKFKDGTTKKYDPAKTLRTFTPDTDYSENKIFLITLFMAEKDSSGFSDFLDEAFGAIKDDLDTILTSLGSAAGAYIGAKIGGTVGSIGGPLGTLIGLLAGIIIGALVAWIVKALKDDVFTPSDENQSVLIIPAATSDFDGSNSFTDYMYFEDYDGKYRVKFTWQIYKS